MTRDKSEVYCFLSFHSDSPLSHMIAAHLSALSIRTMLHKVVKMEVLLRYRMLTNFHGT